MELFFASLLILPLVASVAIALSLRKSEWGGAVVSVSVSGFLLLLTGTLLCYWDGKPIHFQREWFCSGFFKINIGFLFDSKSALLLGLVTFIGFWVHVYSLGYMNKDEGKSRYFAGLSFFMFSMMGIILADNLWMMFLFWELVGFSSYVLIAQYHNIEFANWASRKAFIVNRVGDVGFLLGIIWVYWQFQQTTAFSDLMDQVRVDPNLVKPGMAALLMCGFLSKSAQFPLHIWLPDAMAGPTPVSALIHAATMVAAGVYMMARIPFLMTPEIFHILFNLGLGMTLFGALSALVQKDLKKILAYSTLSQLGLMTVALGMQQEGFALFHLVTHGFFKATLFLCVGMVIYGARHDSNIYHFGGIRKRLPFTTLIFTVAMLSLCGVQGFAGYFSKESILVNAYFLHRNAFYLLAAGVFLTALYIGRLFWVVFWGDENKESHQHPDEKNLFMLIPTIVLGAGSIASGWLFLYPVGITEAFTNELLLQHLQVSYAGVKHFLTYLNSSLIAGGLSLAFLLYKLPRKADFLETRVPWIYHPFNKRLWIDDIYTFYVKNIQDRVCQIINIIDFTVVRGIFIKLPAIIVASFSLILAQLHNGKLHHYVYWLLGGVALYCFI